MLYGFADCMDNMRKPINSTERQRRKGNIPYYGATGQVGWINDFLTNEELVLLGEDGAPFLDTFKKKSYMIYGKAWVNNHAHILKSFYGNKGNFFLTNYLNQFNFNNFVSGTTRLKLTKSSMNNIQIPLPPISELSRIVTKLESMLGKIKETRQLIAQAKESFEKRKAAILNKAFTGELTKEWRKKNKFKETAKYLLQQIINEKKKLAETDKSISVPKLNEMLIPENEHPYKIPNGWAWVYLEAIVKLEYGKGLSGKNRTGRGFPVYGSNGIVGYNEDFLINGPAIIVGRKGSIGEVNWSDNNCWPIDTTYYVQTNKKNNLKYIFYLLKTLNLKSLNRATAIPGLNRDDAYQQKITITNIIEQKQIVKILESIFDKENKTKNIIENFEEHLNLLEKSILSKAFRGELGTNNPADEPAIELLKRVLREKQDAELTAKKQGEQMKKIIKNKSKKIETEKDKNLYEILKERNQKLTPEELYVSSKYNYETVEDFYLELKNAIESKLIIEERPNKTEVYLKAV